MIKIFDKDTNAFIGPITDEQLQFLVDNLEEESYGDNDYYINIDQIDVFQEMGADAELINLLNTALNGREEMEIYWSEE